MNTVVYVKMDAAEQLLLAEGVCRQLGTVSYHPDVLATTGPQTTAAAPVPLVNVFLINSVKIPPRGSVYVQVRCSNEDGTLMVEPDLGVQSMDGLHFPPTLTHFRDGVASVTLSNHSGFTWSVDKDQALGKTEVVEAVKEHTDLPEADGCTQVHRVQDQTSSTVEERKQKLRQFVSHDQDLCQDVQEQLVSLLQKYHDCFSLADNERGQTDLVQFEIDTGAATPCKQRARRMPAAVKEEVSSQLRKMQEPGVIRPSNSPWSSPVVLVRKQDGSHHFGVNYRQRNSVTKTDTFSLPRIDDLLDQLGFGAILFNVGSLKWIFADRCASQVTSLCDT